MNILTKLERKFNGRGIQNLTKIIIGCYIIGYILQMTSPTILSYLYLEPSRILRGEVWRLITWVLTPPDRFDLFTFFMLFFYYSIGVTMERTWGEFRYTVYIISGLIFTIIGGFLLQAIVGSGIGIGMFFTTYYICLSLFLSFASIYPDMHVLLFAVIPIKVKWLGWIYGATILYQIFTYFRYGAWFMAIPVVASLLNFVIFFFLNKGSKPYRPQMRKPQFRQYQQQTAQTQQSQPTAASKKISKHKCAICGQTELDNPELEFRFCSKCNGNYEYCQHHLFIHKHVE